MTRPLPVPIPRLPDPDPLPGKPRQVMQAEYALWLWTAWTCAYGTWQSWREIPEVESQIATQLQFMITIAPATMLHGIFAVYALVGVTSAWIVWKIGAGRHWARSSLLWGFVCEILFEAAPPYHSWLEHLADIPDFGLQIYALYLLYTRPGKGWFEART